MNLKMPKFGVLAPTDFRLFQSAFVVSRDSLRELHVFLPFVTFGGGFQISMCESENP